PDDVALTGALRIVDLDARNGNRGPAAVSVVEAERNGPGADAARRTSRRAGGQCKRRLAAADPRAVGRSHVATNGSIPGAARQLRETRSGCAATGRIISHRPGVTGKDRRKNLRAGQTTRPQTIERLVRIIHTPFNPYQV